MYYLGNIIEKKIDSLFSKYVNGTTVSPETIPTQTKQRTENEIFYPVQPAQPLYQGDRTEEVLQGLS